MSELGFEILDSYIDEDGVRVITKARLHEISIVPESWVPIEWRHTVGVTKILDNDGNVLYTKDSGNTDG